MERFARDFQLPDKVIPDSFPELPTTPGGGETVTRRRLTGTVATPSLPDSLQDSTSSSLATNIGIVASALVLVGFIGHRIFKRFRSKPRLENSPLETVPGDIV